MVASTPPSTTAAPPAKKRLGTGGIVGIVIAVSFLGIVVVANLDHAGKACADEGSMLAAVGCYETMTSIESLLGVRSVRLANAYTDLSLAYSRQSRMKDAMRAQEKAIAMQRDLNGPDSPMVLVLTANLAAYKNKAKDYAGAEKLLKDTLEQAQQKSPPNHYAIGFTLNALIDTYTAQKKWLEAEDAARRLASIDEILVSTGLYPFYGRESVAEVYAKTGRLVEAEYEAREALMRTPGPDKTTGVPAHEILGKILILQGKNGDAKKELDASMALLMKKYGDCDKTQYWKARYAHYLQEKDPFKE